MDSSSAQVLMTVTDKHVPTSHSSTLCTLTIYSFPRWVMCALSLAPLLAPALASKLWDGSDSGLSVLSPQGREQPGTS